MKSEFAWLFGSRVLAGLANALLYVLLARAIEPASFGVVASGLAIFAVASLVGDWGIGPFVSIETAKSRWLHVRKLLVLNSLGAVLVIVMCCLGILVFAGTVAPPLLVCLLSLAAYSGLEKATETSLRVPLAIERGSRFVAANVLGRRLLALLIFAVASVVVTPLVSFGLALVVAALSGWLAVRIWVARRMRGQEASQDEELSLPALVARSTPFAIANLSAGSRDLDVPILTLMAGATAGGLYGAVQRLLAPAFLLPNSVGALLLPRVVGRHVGTMRRSLSIFSVAVVCSSGIGFAIGMFAPEMVGVLLGPGYDAAAPFLQGALVALPFTMSSIVLGALGQGLGFERFIGKNGLIFGLMNLGVVSVVAFAGYPLLVPIAVGAVHALKSGSILIRVMGRPKSH